MRIGIMIQFFFIFFPGAAGNNYPVTPAKSGNQAEWVQKLRQYLITRSNRVSPLTKTDWSDSQRFKQIAWIAHSEQKTHENCPASGGEYFHTI